MIWILFFILIFGLLALDLGVFHKEDKKVSMKESLAWTAVWVGLALLFGFAIYWIYDNNIMGINKHNIDPSRAMIDYYTGYVIEESLSLDNIFVIAMIFKFFQIELKYQHKILFWGIIGAVFFRLLMIALGAAFVNSFSWATYIFGGILLISAFKMIKEGEEQENFQDSFGVRILSKIYPIDWNIKNGHYFAKVNGKVVATPLLATLVVVEFSDILFAVDSIPAIFSITTDPFIVFTSNIFAILGLRNLYFFLANMLDKFKYMKYSLIFVLMFVGFKMIFHHFFKDLPAWASLTIILTALALGIFASLTSNKNKEHLDKNA